MKRLAILFPIVLLAGFAAVSCDVDAKFSDYIPTHALANMVLSATATIGDETVPGVIDNSGHTVQFVFNENSDFSNVDITIEYADRAILKEGAETAFTADLTEGYSFVVNNLEEDYTYTVTATRASVIQIDRLQCSVVTGLANDAPELFLNTGQSNVVYLFDGKWMSKKGDYSNGYVFFGWQNNEAWETGYGDAFTVDLGESFRVARMCFRPYWNYANQDAAVFEIYAYTGPGEPVGEWTDWQLVATVDDSEKWEIEKNLPDDQIGTENDLVVQGTTVEFDYNSVPEARYYRVKVVQNFYAYFGTAMHEFAASRHHWYSLSELEVWKYNTGESEVNHE